MIAAQLGFTEILGGINVESCMKSPELSSTDFPRGKLGHSGDVEIPAAARKRMDAGGVILHWPEGGVVSDRNPPRLPLHGGVSRCAGCGETFRSVAGFDKHQTLDGDGHVICWDPASIGMPKDDRGRWVTSLNERFAND